MARVDYDKQADRYDQGRSLLPEAFATWMVAARRHTGEADRILDLGCGTGRFSAGLADTFDADVVGVEPSSGMRRHAAAKPRDRVSLVAGAAEALPLGDATVDMAWLSNVIHHFDDIPAAARELRRVVKSGGTVLVRGAVGGQIVPSLFRFFPATQAIVDEMPTASDIIGAFQDAGFGYFFNEQVTSKIANSLAEMVPRIRMRADSTLERISDEDFERGLADLEAASQVEDGPVLDPLDLIVIR